MLADQWDMKVKDNEAIQTTHEEKNKSSHFEENGEEWVGHRSWIDQLWMLTRRSFLEISRNKMAIVVKFVFSIFFALVLGAVYSEIDYSQKAIQDRVGLLFFVSINQFFNGFFSVINTFPKEKPIVQRERASKSYSVSAYYVAKFISELPFTLAPPIIFCAILYFMAYLNPLFDRFLIFVLITCMISLASTGLGMIISSFAPNVEAAGALGPPIGVVMILFGGFYINVDSLPLGAQWVRYLALFYWGFQSYLINEFEGASFHCNPDQIGGNATATTTCIENGEQVIRNWSYEPSDGFETGVIGITILAICFHFAAYAIIRLNRLKVMKLGDETEEGYGEDPTKDVKSLDQESKKEETI